MRRTAQRLRPLRVFVGLTEVAGYYSKVAVGLADLGHDVTVVFLADPYGYLNRDARQVQPPRFIVALLARVGGRRDLLSRTLSAVGRLLLFGWTLLRCDAYVLAGGSSFFRGFDLPIMRCAHKRVLAVFNGSDVRPPYLSGLEWVGTNRPNLESIYRRTQKTFAHVRRVERGVTEIIGHPAFSQFQSRRYYSYLAIGVPVPAMPPHMVVAGMEVPIILHAPTRPLHKGTAEIESLLDALRSEGFDFEYRVLMGLPNAEVLRALQTSDIVVDEIHGDTLLGGLGAEGAAAGCAVVVAGYAGRIIEQTHSCPLPAVHLIDPNDLLRELRRKLSDIQQTREEGRALRAFVESYWSTSAIASRIIAIFDGTADPAWTIDPLDVIYVEGWGVSQETLRAGLEGYVARYGPGGLFVEHHPRLQAALLEFATS